MQIEPIFPQAVIGYNKLEVDSNKILKYLESIEFEKTNSSTSGTANSQVSKNYNVFKDIGYLKEEICKNVQNYLNNIMKLKMDFQFTTSWATKTLPNGYSQKHKHSNSFLSGVYYPIGDKNFNIKFYKKSGFWDIEKSEANNFNADFFNISIVEDGILILFPSDLVHSIEKNLSDKTRYSIAFNTLPLGEIGGQDSKINFK